MHDEAHARDLAWLNAQVTELDHSDVDIIFSHWSPSRDGHSIDPRHAQSPITSGFETNLSGEVCYNSSNVKTWAFGHTQYNCGFEVEREGHTKPLRLVANQRGYYFAQATGYDGDKVIES
ncbi:uncharacterized protein LY79DRAFT_11133 [Colletotrichum navitas]|uniref:Uncharacterized protein n=1 Tax=Colletotrichum navitas TaxID=681940 RepID=A0AAD8VCN3_9PEZI|nr:uncharacterized protein LY79DRAFT_11133 [Colletotrichum navitas]KAK1600216.1 hypothetical protein LY79DRAFT_11133 [Colletotrichum navitas]